jgi:ATP-dependent Lhr-like helicase
METFPTPDSPALRWLEGWFATQGWSPFDFQRRTWHAYLAGRSGIVNVPTGAGKTYAAWLGPLAALADERAGNAPSSAIPAAAPALRVLYITPLRAMTRDIELALRAPVAAAGWNVSIESRTGDTSASQRARQNRAMPNVLVTTPESAALLICRDDAPELLSRLDAVIVDEWHEFLSTKRGTQIELTLSRLRSFSPRLRTWGMSATIANLDQALRTLVGVRQPGVLVRDELQRPLIIDSLLPESVDAFPWAGHLGMVMLERLVAAIDIRSSTLIFTNVRSQTERWFQAILSVRPEWEGLMALHHGSLDRDDREATEEGLKSGRLRLVVCTSSLDLGVDFAAVEQVFQIGSPRGVARLLQRAGRSGHRPGAMSRVVCVPTHALELVEIAALRRAVQQGDMESRVPLVAPVDVLVQHMVTCALGGGFTPEGLFDEIRGTVAYEALSATEFSWILNLVESGGATLHRYPEYRKIELVNGRFRVTSAKTAMMHRMNIGTIVSDSSIEVTFANGRSLGTIEEVFIASLKAGQKFVFAGKVLELVSHRGLKAVVKPAVGPVNSVPRWGGYKLPITDVLSRQVRALLQDLDATARDESTTVERELQVAQPVLQAQHELSAWPTEGQLLAETCRTREGHHLFVYPFEGRLVHEGLAALLAWRLAQREKATFSYSINDYGFELLSTSPFDYAGWLTASLFDPADWEEQAQHTVNVAELAKMRFREIARVSMLTPQSTPAARKAAKHMHANAGMLFDIFHQFDPENLLLKQSFQEVMDRNFERKRLVATMQRLAASQLILHHTARPTPLAFPLIVERMGARLSTESLMDRIERMKVDYGSPTAPQHAIDERLTGWGRLMSG